MSLQRWTLLAHRALRPERPRLAEARAIVAGLADVRSAWGALAARGLVPATELPRGAYRSTVVEPAARWTVWTPEQHVTALPSTVDAAVTLAADPNGILRASAQAIEARTRLHPPIDNSTSALARVAWRVVEAGWRPSESASLPSAMNTLTRALTASQIEAWRQDALHETTAITRTVARGVPTAVLNCAVGDILWRRAVASGHALGNNPYEPLLGVWSEGYGVDRFEGEVVVLAAPGV